jgi:hypothetical protein
MAVALDLLTVKAAQAGASVRKAAAAEVIESLIHRHAPLRNSSEVAWAIWAAIALEVDLTAIAAQDVASMEDDFVALLALHADSSGRFPAGALDKTNWETLINYDAVLKGDHWLLAYENTRKNWLTSAQPRVAADPFFSILLKGWGVLLRREPREGSVHRSGGSASRHHDPRVLLLAMKRCRQAPRSNRPRGRRSLGRLACGRGRVTPRSVGKWSSY